MMAVLPLPEEVPDPKTGYVALRTRPESETLATVLNGKQYRTAVVEHNGRGSDLLVMNHLRNNTPAVAFVSADYASVIHYFERSYFDRAMRTLTVEVHSDGRKEFFQGQGGRKPAHDYAQYGGVRRPKSPADYIIFGGIDMAVEFVESYLEMIVREEQKQWRLWLAQNHL